MATWPTLRELRALLRLEPNGPDEPVLEAALRAAVDYGVRRLAHRYGTEAEDLPEAAHQACLLHAARLYRRRDSLDGTAGWGELGVVRIATRDYDVAGLYDAVGPVVFG